jgi:hypothetical protein
MRLSNPQFLAALALIGAPALAVAADSAKVDWIAQHGWTLELKLAHEDQNGPDGGILHIDPTRRLILWAGIPGELGCKLKVEVSFDDVKSVRVRNDVGFMVELRREKDAQLVFMPLPDARWLSKGRRVTEGTLATAMRGSSFTGPDKQPMILTGDAAFAGPRTERVELPPEVRNDVNTAVALIRQALGRGPSPAGALQEALHGRPIDVSVQDLLEFPSAYLARTVRLRGRIQKAQVRSATYRLVDGGDEVLATPLEELAAVVGAQVRNQEGLEVEITGVLKRLPVKEGPSVFCVTFWEYYGPGAVATRSAQPSRLVTLEDLVTHPGSADGQLVRVVGKFRGRNLFGDLPSKNIGSGTWVIKAGKHAVVVAGKKPSGPGFELDLDSEGGTVNWLEVVGRPETRDGTTLLHALSVAPAVPPPSAQVRGGLPRLLGVGGPAVIVFTLPLEGEQAIVSDSRFIVQFSAYMDEDSFQGHVRLRYANGMDVPGMTWRYDDDRRALIVDPGGLLRPGQQLELLLLPGILDAGGAPLAPRLGATVDGAVELLSYKVGS